MRRRERRQERGLSRPYGARQAPLLLRRQARPPRKDQPHHRLAHARPGPGTIALAESTDRPHVDRKGGKAVHWRQPDPSRHVIGGAGAGRRAFFHAALLHFPVAPDRKTRPPPRRARHGVYNRFPGREQHGVHVKCVRSRGRVPASHPACPTDRSVSLRSPESRDDSAPSPRDDQP